MSGRVDRGNIPYIFTWRLFVFSFILAAFLVLIFSFPVKAAEVYSSAFGEDLPCLGGFQKPAIPVEPPSPLFQTYLAEGTTCEGMETWVVVFNPHNYWVSVDLSFYTEDERANRGLSVAVPAKTRKSFLLNSLVPNKRDVSTRVVSVGGNVVCERAVYGPGRAWAHESVGITEISNEWYLAEGTTCGGMETWVVVFNPTESVAVVDLNFYTENGEVVGPQDFPILKGHRQAFLLNSLVPNKKDVSTVVHSSVAVVCERAVYGPGGVWAHGSRGEIYADATWYLAEGTTCGGMETWVVVFNPGPGDAVVDLTFYVDGGEEVTGPQNATITSGHRQAFLLNSLVPNKKDVSTVVSCDTGKVVCERAVYGPGRAWAHDSVGVTNTDIDLYWDLAEGTTYGGMETWVVVFNPGHGEAVVDLDFYTESGKVPGPQNFSLPKGHRQSFLLNSLVPDKKDVSTIVSCDSGAVVCERAVYGPGRRWAHESMVAIH